MKHVCILCKIIGAIAIIGALNWGSIGLFGYNFVDHLFGVGSPAARITYILVGLSGLALLAKLFCPSCCGCCGCKCANCSCKKDGKDYIDRDKDYIDKV